MRRRRRRQIGWPLNCLVVFATSKPAHYISLVEFVLELIIIALPLALSAGAQSAARAPRPLAGRPLCARASPILQLSILICRTRASRQNQGLRPNWRRVAGASCDKRSEPAQRLETPFPANSAKPFAPSARPQNNGPIASPSPSPSSRAPPTRLTRLKVDRSPCSAPRGARSEQLGHRLQRRTKTRSRPSLFREWRANNSIVLPITQPSSPELC